MIYTSYWNDVGMVAGSVPAIIEIKFIIKTMR